MMIKKILGIIMSTAIALSVFSLTTFAAGEMVFEPSSATAKAGDTVAITVTMKNNTGIASAGFYLYYDETLTYVDNSFVAGNGFTPANASIATVASSKAGYAALYYSNYTTTDITADGELCTVQFTVPAGTAAGDYDIIVEADPDPIFGCVNVAGDAVVVATASSKVTVESDEPQTKTVGLVASLKYDNTKTGVAFTVKDTEEGLTSAPYQVSYAELAETTIENLAAITVGLNVTDVPVDSELEATAELY